MFPYIGAVAVRLQLAMAFNSKRLLWGKFTAIAVGGTQSCQISDEHGHVSTGGSVSCFRHQGGVGSLLATAVFDRCPETPRREACGNVFAAIVCWGHTDTAQSG